VKLGEVCEVSWGNTSITKASYELEGFPAYSATGADGHLPSYEYDREAVVLSAIGARCGKCFRAGGKWTAIKNTIVIFPKDKTDSDVDFLFFYLNREEVWPTDAMAQPFITMGGAQSVLVPLPPLPEQRRIAGILKEQMAAVEKARAAAEAQLQAAKALPAAYLREVFPAPDAPLPQGWRWVKLGEVCDVVNGFGFPEHLQGRKDLPFPFIKVSDMNTEGSEIVVSYAANSVDDELLTLVRGKTYPAGTIIFPKVGGALLTNKKRVLGRRATFDNNVMGLVPKSVDSEWLYYWMLTIDLRELANTQALPSIRQSEVAALSHPLPPLPEQRRIAGILKEQMAAVEKARAAAEAQLSEINALPSALLRQAFSGLL
jgi:type I restriction enzyme S subunit